MSREWKPGDVAMATFDHGGTGLVFRVICAPSDWCDMAGVCAPIGQIENLRPLVVIDPEDGEAIKRLIALFQTVESAPLTSDVPLNINELRMQAALREFANPTPPKPEEPTGLGAVVEDAQGRIWTRLGGDPAWGSYDPPMDVHDIGHYDDIAVIRVLSPGWSA